VTNKLSPLDIKEIPFEELIEALLDENHILKPRFLYRLSDLERDEYKQLKNTWPKIPSWRRQALMEDLEQLAEANNLLSFERVGRIALQDDDPRVRFLAIRSLKIYETPDLLHTYMDMVESDKNSDVRAMAASALGKYVYLGEIDKLPKKSLRNIEEMLLEVTQGDDEANVRRRALEALGYSSRRECAPLVEAAYTSGDTDWLVSALFAMGRSYNKRWKSQVIEMLESNHDDVLFEAVRASGELEISEAVPRLMELLEKDDWYVYMASIWSLSQIGGHGVEEILRKLLDQAEDEEEATHLETALDNLAFTEGMPLYGFFDFEGDLDSNEGTDDLPFENVS